MVIKKCRVWLDYFILYFSFQISLSLYVFHQAVMPRRETECSRHADNDNIPELFKSDLIHPDFPECKLPCKFS